MYRFKKYNKKQIAYSEKKKALAMTSLFRRFLLLFSIIAIGLVILPQLFAEKVDWDSMAASLTGIGAGYTFMTMAIIGDIGEISDKYAAPNQINMRVYLLALDQVDQDETFPSANSDRELGTIPTLSGQCWHYFDAIPDSPDEIATATKGEIITEFSNTFSIIVAGNREKHLDFIEDYSGKGFIIVYQIGEDLTRYIIGSVYKPMILQISDRKGGGKEGRYITFTFQNKHWRQPLIYVGSLVRQSAETVAQDATNLPITSAEQYQLTDGSVSSVTIATVSGIGSNDYGRVIELLAPASASYAPNIADNTVFVMIDAVTWTANPGSRISFKIIDDSTLLEVANTRVQTAP